MGQKGAYPRMARREGRKQALWCTFVLGAIGRANGLFAKFMDNYLISLESVSLKVA